MAKNQKQVFTLKKKEDFLFALEAEPQNVYSLPAIGALDLNDGALMTKIDDEDDIVKKGELIKDFILKYNPGLAGKEVKGMEWFEIFNAYAMSEGRDKLGESKASQDS